MPAGLIPGDGTGLPLEPDMTDDQITAALDQLAAQREQITRLDAREATHYATLTGLLARLTARTGPDPAPDDPGGYQLLRGAQDSHGRRL